MNKAKPFVIFLWVFKEILVLEERKRKMVQQGKRKVERLEKYKVMGERRQGRRKFRMQPPPAKERIELTRRKASWER